MMIEWDLDFAGKLKKSAKMAFKKRSSLSFEELVGYGLIERPHYVYCAYHAAELAARLGVNKVSIIEFGVAGGNGLVALEAITDLISEKTALDVEFEIYGFDTGEGMPELAGSSDLPYWFKAGQYKMDEDALRSRLKKTQLVIGNVKDTIPRFIQNGLHAPIGAMMIDVDYYSSTNDCLKLIESNEIDSNFLPRLHIYLDDIIGGSIEMYGPFNGMLRSIEEFNGRHEDRKVHLNQNLIGKSHVDYRHQIYYAHLFGHKDYDTYVGSGLQENMSERLKLKFT